MLPYRATRHPAEYFVHRMSIGAIPFVVEVSGATGAAGA
jgi:hypothetical protein